MQYEVQVSSTTRPLLFFMTDSSDHVTGKTGLSPTVTISKNGGAFASPSGAVSEIGSGWYKVAGNATDSNTSGPLALHATGTGADPDDRLFVVVPWNPDDAVRLGLTAIPNATAGAAGGIGDTVRISGDDVAADRLETMLDGTGGNTLSLGALNVVNTSGTAVTFLSAGSNGSGLVIAGNGSGHGIQSTAGATGNGMQVLGGATSGHAMRIYAQAGDSYGMQIEGAGTGAAHGVNIVGLGTGHGLRAVGGGGLVGNGGGATGNGFEVVSLATNGIGLNVAGSGSGNGATITGGATGNGFYCLAGATSGSGFAAVSTTSGNGAAFLSGGGGNPGLAIQASTTSPTGAVEITQNGTGAGMRIHGSAYGLRIDTAGDGLWIDTVPGSACIKLTPPGSGAAIEFAQGVGYTGPMIQGTLDFENFLDNAIDAGSLATDTITSAKIATSAVDEIVDGVWDEALSGHTTAGTAGKTLADVTGGGAVNVTVASYVTETSSTVS